MQGRSSRNLIRFLTGTTLSVALLAAVLIPTPEVLPAVAIRQATLYRLEVALLAFYGCLLLVTPAFSGLIRGQLPVEISARGARFAEEADQSTKLNQQGIEELKVLITDLIERLDLADAEIEQLKKAPERDNAQPPISSRK